MTDRTPCRTPKGGTPTNVPTWKVEACRAALLAEIGDGIAPAKGLAERAGARLSEAERAELGSLGWHMTTVRLELETRGEIERLPGAPVRLRRR